MEPPLQKSPDKCIFFDKNDLRVMSRIAITSKVSKRWMLLYTGINLVPFMPDEDKTFSGLLVLDLRI